jgi:hypothetical protein
MSRASKHITALVAPDRPNKTAMLKLGEDYLKETRRYRLCEGDLLYLDRVV